MRILVTGGGGMIGQKFAQSLAANNQGVRELVLHDLVEPTAIEDAPFKVTLLCGNIASQMEAKRLAALNADAVVHLAAIAPAEAEENFEMGWAVNARATYNLLEAIRHQSLENDNGYRPKFIYASSIAVFGAPYPIVIDDEFLSAPLTSHGAQKVIGEMCVADFSNKGYVDGISIRFPTICVRPGKPDQAASSFFSSIIREPLNGEKAILPVPREICHWLASPRSAAGFIRRALELDFDLLEGRRALNMPGISLSVGEMIEALERQAGSNAIKLIREKTDETILAIVRNWPHAFAPDRAIELGFEAENSFDEIIQAYLEDDFEN